MHQQSNADKIHLRCISVADADYKLAPCDIENNVMCCFHFLNKKINLKKADKGIYLYLV